MKTSEQLAGIDVHKSMLAVVIGEMIDEGHWQFRRRKFATCASQLREVEVWLSENKVQEVVMESTAQYWKPVWHQLEGKFHLHLAQAQSNRAPKGRKQDFADAERLVRRFAADELILSFIPDPEQRLWRTLTHTKYQLKRDRVRLQNQLESLLEDARIKLSSYVTDLLGVSSRRMLEAMAGGETDPARLAAMAHAALHASNDQLQ